MSDKIEKSVSIKILSSYHKIRYVAALSHPKIHKSFILFLPVRFVARNPVIKIEKSQSHA